MEKMRLQKYLAQCGVASRRACEDLIRAGRVTVNDETVMEACDVRQLAAGDSVQWSFYGG